jgi:hypothetical protein
MVAENRQLDGMTSSQREIGWEDVSVCFVMTAEGVE